jgi:hypothetical protein
MAGQQDSLTLRLGDRRKAVDADGFILLFQSVVSALKAVDKGLSTYGAETLQWRVIEIGANSPLFATIQGVLDRPDSEGYGQQVVDTLVGGIEHLAGANSCPANFTRDVLAHVKQMAQVGVRYGLHPIVATGRRETKVRRAVAKNADWAIRTLDLRKRTYKEYGTLQGMLKELSVSRGRDKLVLVERLTGEETPCYLRGEGLDAVVREAWKKRVAATGDIYVDRESRRPVRILVDAIRILGEREELPQMQDLHGIDITNGVESSEYIRGLRDDD